MSHLLAAQHKSIVKTNQAPTAPLSTNQAIKSNGLLFISGQVGIDNTTKHLVAGGIQAETEQAMKHLTAIIEAAEAKMTDLVSVTVYLKDLKTFQQFNEVYTKHISGDFPARTVVEVSQIAHDANIEISAIVAVPFKPRRK